MSYRPPILASRAGSVLPAGRPAPGRAPPRAIDYSCGLILFKARGAIQSARGYSKRLQQRRARRLRPPPIVAGIPYICPPPIAAVPPPVAAPSAPAVAPPVGPLLGATVPICTPN